MNQCASAVDGSIGVQVEHENFPGLTANGEEFLGEIEIHFHIPNVRLDEVESEKFGDSRVVDVIPPDDVVLAGFGEIRVAKEFDAVHVVAVDLSGGEVGEMQSHCGKRASAERLNLVALCDFLVNLFRVQVPYHHVVVDPTGNKLFAVRRDVDGQHLVAMTANTGENGDARRVPHVPEPDRVVFAACEEKVLVDRVELQIVNCSG